MKFAKINILDLNYKNDVLILWYNYGIAKIFIYY